MFTFNSNATVTATKTVSIAAMAKAVSKCSHCAQVMTRLRLANGDLLMCTDCDASVCADAVKRVLFVDGHAVIVSAHATLAGKTLVRIATPTGEVFQGAWKGSMDSLDIGSVFAAWRIDTGYGSNATSGWTRA